MASNSDLSLFIKKHEGICIGDNIIIIGNNNAKITRPREELSLPFEIKKIGESLPLEMKKIKQVN